MQKVRMPVTVGFTGFDGGSLASLVDFNIHVNSNIIEHVEDIHLMLEHIVVKSLREQAPFGFNDPHRHGEHSNPS
jgi:hypothetical protein